MTDTIVFELPQPIRDWVFDIQDATRRSLRSEEVQPLYEAQFRDLTDRFFPQSPWPAASSIAPECNYDEDFLLFYKEIRARHLFTLQYVKDTKLKPQLSDFIDSWTTYTKIFEYILSKQDIDRNIALTTQWISDIIVEFVYQFQGFCQYRCQIQGRSAEDMRTLEANRQVWAIKDVMSTLKALSKAGNGSRTQVLHQQFGYFASIERARLECLLGDYTESLIAISSINLWDRSELFNTLPSVHVNLFYHAGLCYLMLRRYSDAIATLGEIALHISRMLKPGSSTNARGLESQMKKMLDKILALTGINFNLSPGARVDDQVRELAEGKFPEKMRRLANGDIQTFADLFEMTGPKFISPAIPDYGASLSGEKEKVPNKCQEVYSTQVAVFRQEVVQQIAVLKLRSYLRLYASIELPKLARFSELSEAELFNQVLSYKHKLMQVTSAQPTKRISTSDVHYFLTDGSLVIETSSSKSDKQRQTERYFLAGIRRHAEIINDVDSVFKSIGI